MFFKLTSDSTDPWKGSLEDLLENQEISEFVRRRIENLQLGERVCFEFATAFTVERIK